MIVHPPPQLRLGSLDMAELVVPNDLRSAKAPESLILGELERNGYDGDSIFGLKLALEEAMTNAVKHGNRGDPTKHITVRYRITPDRAVIMVADEGPGFAPECVPDPTSDENIERPNGRGIMLMQCYMSRVCYNACGNEVWLVKDRADPSNPCCESRLTAG